MLIKKLGILCLTLILSSHAYAETIEVGDTGITFSAPDGFQPMSEEWKRTKWPGANRPSFAVGNERGSTTIAFDAKPQDISHMDLNELRTALAETFNLGVPGLKWVANKIIEHDGQSWIYLEMTSTALDTDIYNIVMLTGWNRQMVLFNFNSTREEFPRYEDALRASVKSIRLP